MKGTDMKDPGSKAGSLDGVVVKGIRRLNGETGPIVLISMELSSSQVILTR